MVIKMKLKIMTIVIIMFLIYCNFSVLGTINSKNILKSSDFSDFGDKNSVNVQKKEIKVALFSKTIFMVSCYKAFFEALDGYSWIANDTQYTFIVDKIYDKDIYRGDLSTDNYDVLLMPGGGAGGGCVKTKWQRNRPLVMLWRNNMINFIKDGGGYYGVCGGTWFFLGFDGPPRSLSELKTDRSSLGLSCVKLQRNEKPSGNIIINQLLGRYDRIGPGHAYMYYSGWNFGPTQIYPGCLYVDVTVNTSHPFLDDYLDDTIRFSWSASPVYVVPESPDRELTVLANFPEEEFSDNEKTKIHYWKYTGGIRGLIKGFIRHIKEDKTLFGDLSLANAWYMASDWEKTDEIIKTNCSGKPFMTAEVYPNENQARIFLCSGHAETGVYFGGEIIEVEDTDSNNLYDGLIGWTNYSAPDETEEDERTHFWWVIRRGVAWAAKVPDNDLPPIYGPSQVSNIYPYNQSINFKIYGNSEISDGIASLDLYYRYSLDDGEEDPWSDWTFYDTDVDWSDGWSWYFISPEGTGYYQFYSIRHIKYGYEELIEKAPGGPDAIAYVYE